MFSRSVLKMLLQVFILSCLIIGNGFGDTLVNNVENEVVVETTKHLKDLEKEIHEIFNTSVKICREELGVLKNFVARVKAEHDKVTDNEDYLENPINAYSLIKRMTLDWEGLKSALTNLQGIQYFKKEMETLRATTQMPNMEDLTAAAKDILNMQTVSNLRVADLVNGVINGKDYGDKLEWDDCFEIGKVAYENRQLELAKEWFLAALPLLQLENDSTDKPFQISYELQIEEYLALIDYELGENESALQHIDSILAEYPEHPAKNTKNYILLNEKADFFNEDN